MERPAWIDHTIIALASCAVLLFEVAITRLLSAVLWYHFAFLAISMAMLGLGAPGIWFSLRPPGVHALRRLLLAAGVAVPLSVIVIVRWLAPLGLAVQSPNLKIALTFVCMLVPLTLLGGAVCILLLRASGRRIGRMYGADLLGATIGAALVVPLMHLVPTPTLLAAIGFLPLGAVLLDAGRRPGAWRDMSFTAALGVVLVLLTVIAWAQPLQLEYNKNYAEASLNRLYERWTATARLTVFPGSIYSPDRGLAFGWGLGTEFPGQRVEQHWIDQDGSAGTPITRLAATPAELDHLDYDVTTIGYQLRPPRSACVIGAGGGRDILTALRAGAESVDAVELNGHIIEIVAERFGDFSGDPYHLPGVRAHASEGRSFLMRRGGQYDLLQISLIDSWAATAAGAYALSENYLYTLEAMRLYWERLADRGLLSISRWIGGEHGLESGRLVLMIEAALALDGVAEPKRHLAVVRGGIVATALVSRTPFTAGEIARLDAIAGERGFERLWPPVETDDDAAGEPATPPILVGSGVVAQVLTEGPGSWAAKGLDLTPPTDDRPFFFQNVRAFTRLDPEAASALSVNDRAARLPRLLIGLIGVITLALFFSPFLLARSLERHPGFWRGSAYFIAIGLGFMLVEAPLIQKFILYLGHPSYATTVVLAALLLGSGLGSFTAGRARTSTVTRLRLLLPLGVAAVNLVLPAIFSATLAWAVSFRVEIGLLVMVPLGFLLGFAFPVGMVRFGDGNRAWFWAMNGAASVLATVSSVTLAAYVGLTHVVWIGVACYLLACLLLSGARAAGSPATAAPARSCAPPRSHPRSA